MGEGAELQMRELWERARASWPQVEVSFEDFRAAAHDVVTEGGLEAEPGAELYLACGCAMGQRYALERFDALYLSAARAALRGFDLDPGEVDDVLQTVRRRLLLANDGNPKLLRYAGRGSLRGLVRVTATRAAIDVVRGRKGQPEQAGDDLLRLPVGEDDPELAAIKAEFRTEFRVAFEQAMASLSARQRTLLRLHLIDGVAFHKLAASYDVHRATVVRWVAAAKKELLDATVQALTERTREANDELDGFFGLIRSRLELSVRRLLESG